MICLSSCERFKQFVGVLHATGFVALYFAGYGDACSHQQGDCRKRHPTRLNEGEREWI